MSGCPEPQGQRSDISAGMGTIQGRKIGKCWVGWEACRLSGSLAGCGSWPDHYLPSV